jgi:TPR repeat protein
MIDGCSIYGNYYEISIGGRTVTACVNCRNKIVSEQEAQKEDMMRAILGPLEESTLAVELNPPSKQLQENLQIIRERAKAFNVPIPANAAALRLELGFGDVDTALAAIRSSTSRQQTAGRKWLQSFPATLIDQLPKLLNALKDRSSSKDERVLLLGTIGELGPAAVPAVGDLLHCLLDEAAEVRIAAFSALDNVSASWHTHSAVSAYLPSMVEGLESDGNLGNAATQALVVIGLRNPEVIPALIQVVQDGKKSAPLNSANVLAKLGGTKCRAEVEAAVPVLLHCLTIASENVLGSVMAALDTLFPEWSTLPQTADIISTSFSQLEQNVEQSRARAVAVLSLLGRYCNSVVDRLSLLLNHSDSAVVLAVLNCLEELGPHARSVVPKLVSLIIQPSSEIRAAALRALDAVAVGWHRTNYAAELVAPLAAQVKKYLFKPEKWAEEMLSLIDSAMLRRLQRRRKRILYAVSLSCFCALFGLAALAWHLYTLQPSYQFNLGVELLNQTGGPDPRAVQAFQSAAVKGHFEAAGRLAKLYEEGRLVGTNLEMAIHLYQQAIGGSPSSGPWYTEAQYDLARLLSSTGRSEQEHQEALDLYRAAAAHGHPESQYRVAMTLLEGHDLSGAAEWLLKAADQGHVKAMKQLASMYKDGRGVPKDETRAAKWYERATQQGQDGQGDAGAELALGLMYTEGQGVAKSDVSAFDWLIRAANQGNSTAQFQVALMYQEGRGTTANSQHSLEMLQKAAALHYVPAMSRLAQLYEDRGGSSNDALALQWYRMAAEQNDAHSQYELGMRYREGRGVERNDSEAVKWFHKAADQGDDDARTTLAELYVDEGKWTNGAASADVKLNQAADLLLRAANSSHAEAQYRVGLLFEQGHWGSTNRAQAVDWFSKAASQKNVEAAKRLSALYRAGQLATQDLAQVVIWCRMAAESGDTESQVSLGLLYRKGEGVQRDDREAYQWFTRAAMQSNIVAQFNLGDMTDDGFGTTASSWRAAEWYRNAAQNGYAPAQRRLGWMYATGHGLSRDRAAAIEWYRKAADQGDAIAQYNIGLAYRQGDGVESNDVEAANWFRKAAQQGDMDSKAELVKFMVETNVLSVASGSNREEVVSTLEVAAQQGNMRAASRLATLYSTGQIVTYDMAQAIKWYRIAADGGDTESQVNLGLLYRKGKGVNRDDTEAYRLFTAAKGNMVAQFNLGDMTDDGLGTKLDSGQAAEWYQQAARQGYAPAQRRLGWMYTKGRGVDRDRATAIEWYRKAADQGDAIAQYNLGLSYAQGDGVQRDAATAAEWFGKAAGAGDGDAQIELAQMYYVGRGVPKSIAEALKLLENATESADESVQKRALALRQALTGAAVPSHKESNTHSALDPHGGTSDVTASIA